jgi:hypothetical protein
MAAPRTVVAHCIGYRGGGGLSARWNDRPMLRLATNSLAKSNPYIAQRV